MSENTIRNPFRKGDTVVIPAGTLVRTTHPSTNGWRVTKRTQTITLPVGTFDGWVDTMNEHKRGNGFVALPQVCWAGSGGYWMYAQVTPAFCAVNGIDMPVLPDISDRYGAGWLDVEPSYDPGYTDKWDEAAARRAAA